jgi:hypothetical protein
MTRTFSRVDWDAAQAAWSDVELGAEWLEVRRRAAIRGMLWPPNGTRWDSWDDDNPSQVAIVIRAIRETPDVLLECIDRSASWGEAIGRLIAIRDVWAADQRRQAALEEREWAAAKARDRAESAVFMSRLGAALASSTNAPTSAQEGAQP